MLNKVKKNDFDIIDMLGLTRFHLMKLRKKQEFQKES